MSFNAAWSKFASPVATEVITRAEIAQSFFMDTPLSKILSELSYFYCDPFGMALCLHLSLARSLIHGARQKKLHHQTSTILDHGTRDGHGAPLLRGDRRRRLSG